jgi:flavin-dependent dehydrogenase
LRTDWDAIVVGANVAGASVAFETTSRGLDVVMVERAPIAEIGSKSCGDGVERYQFEKLDLPIPRGEFMLRDVEVAYLNSPDRTVRLRGESAGIAIDRYGLNQHLVRRAIGSGTQMMDNTEASSPVVEGGRVVGVDCRARDSGETHRLRAPVTVDATGWRGQLRRALPGEWPVAEEVPRHETALAYREERRRSEPVDEMVVEATFDFDIAPLGLYWVADRTETLVNVGIGMQWVPGLPRPGTQIRERVIPLYPGLESTEVIRAGGGIIPNRRPIDCPVAPGLMAVGDAACQVMPLTGSGIGASMYAAGLLASTLVEALEANRSPGMEDLFGYAHAYHTSYGVDQAANQMLRASLQALSNRQLNRLMGSRLVSEEELVSAARQGRLDMSFGRKMKAAARLLGEPRLIRALGRMQSDMESARALYRDYPERPSGLEAWRKRASRVFGPQPQRTRTRAR